MKTQGASEGLNLLDRHFRALIERVYLRPSLDEPALEVSGSEFFACDSPGRTGRRTIKGMIITALDSLKPGGQDASLEALGKAVGSLAK